MTQRTKMIVAGVVVTLIVVFVVLWWQASAQAQRIAALSAPASASREGPSRG